MLFLGMGSIIVFWGFMSIKGEAIRLSPITNPAVALRNIGDLMAINGMCLALVYVPLSTVGAVIQTVPLMVTAAAALFLGERVGKRRGLAIFIGFLGTLFIIQPGAATFDIATSLVFVAAIGMALILAPSSFVKIFRRYFWHFIRVLYSSSAVVFLIITGGSVPDMDTIFIVMAMIALGSLGFFFMTEAIRWADMSVVVPFRYTRLLFSVAVGIIILGEQVNAVMLFGSALTILSGLYIWHREVVIQN